MAMAEDGTRELALEMLDGARTSQGARSGDEARSGDGARSGQEEGSGDGARSGRRAQSGGGADPTGEASPEPLNESA